MGDYPCKWCAKTFATSGLRSRHQIRSHGHDQCEKPKACSYCPKRFWTNQALTGHTRTHTGERPFSCPECTRKFAIKTTLDTHVRKVHRASELKLHACQEPGCGQLFGSPWLVKLHERTHTELSCSVCNKPFPCRAYLVAHRRIHRDTESRKLPCSECDKVYLTNAALRRHVKEAHQLKENEKPFSCSYCKKRFWNSTSLTNHTRTHTGERPFPCTICALAFTEKHTLDGHVRHVHAATGSLQLHRCPQPGCGKQFSRAQVLKLHLLRHEPLQPIHPCPTCGMLYSSKPGLLYHVQSVHEVLERRHACTYCEKKFTSATILVSHVRSHTGEKPYACPNCPTKFASLKGLNSHQNNMHKREGARTYECPTSGCGKRFGSQSNLTAHVGKHSSDRTTFPCRSCNKEYLTKAGLKLHTQIHHEQAGVSHNCEYCQKKFHTSWKLVAHVRTHTGEKPYPCPVCGKRFNTSTQCKKHLEVHKSAVEREWYDCDLCGKGLTSRANLNAHIKRHQMS